MIRPSFIQRFGYSAAIAAAISPARSPATVRPTSAMSTTTPAPKNAIVSRCESDVLAVRVELLVHPRRRRERDRGERRVLRGLRAVTRVGEPVAARELVGGDVVIDLVALLAARRLGDEHVPHPEREGGEDDEQEDSPEAHGD